jgi:hypothetical protein
MILGRVAQTIPQNLYKEESIPTANVLGERFSEVTSVVRIHGILQIHSLRLTQSGVNSLTSQEYNKAEKGLSRNKSGQRDER